MVFADRSCPEWLACLNAEQSRKGSEAWEWVKMGYFTSHDSMAHQSEIVNWIFIHLWDPGPDGDGFAGLNRHHVH